MREQQTSRSHYTLEKASGLQQSLSREIQNPTEHLLGRGAEPVHFSKTSEVGALTQPGRALIHTAQHKVAQVLRSASSHLFFTLGKYFKER